MAENIFSPENGPNYFAIQEALYTLDLMQDLFRRFEKEKEVWPDKNTSPTTRRDFLQKTPNFSADRFGLSAFYAEGKPVEMDLNEVVAAIQAKEETVIESIIARTDAAIAEKTEWVEKQASYTSNDSKALCLREAAGRMLHLMKNACEPRSPTQLAVAAKYVSCIVQWSDIPSSERSHERVREALNFAATNTHSIPPYCRGVKSMTDAKILERFTRHQVLNNSRARQARTAPAYRNDETLYRSFARSASSPIPA